MLLNFVSLILTSQFFCKKWRLMMGVLSSFLYNMFFLEFNLHTYINMSIIAYAYTCLRGDKEICMQKTEWKDKPLNWKCIFYWHWRVLLRVTILSMHFWPFFYFCAILGLFSYEVLFACLYDSTMFWVISQFKICFWHE